MSMIGEKVWSHETQRSEPVGVWAQPKTVTCDTLPSMGDATTTTVMAAHLHPWSHCTLVRPSFPAKP